MHAAHAVLLPGQRHRCPEDGKVHVVHHRTLFDLGRSMAPRATDLARYLLDHQLDVGTPAHIGHNAHVFETHQGGEDLSRVDKDEGTSCFLAHTSSLKCLRPILGDLERAAPRQNPKSRPSSTFRRFNGSFWLAVPTGFEPVSPP